MYEPLRRANPPFRPAGNLQEGRAFAAHWQFAGGGGSNDLLWGRCEDEREWAHRCACEAARVIGKKPRTGRKR